MALLNWTSQMSVGVRQIDDDHKKLIDMINELHTGMLAGKSSEVVGGVLRRLASYTVEHFNREEAYFAKTNYSDAATHKREHEKLKLQVMAEIEKFRSGNAAGLGMEALTFLRDWMKHHILESDKAYTAHLNQHGIH